MNLKRSIALLMAVITVMSCSNVSVAAISNDSEHLREGALGAAELISEQEQQKIDELYAQRLKLCVDYEKNRKAINKIDKQIQKLGAVELTSEKVAEKMKASTKDGAVFYRQNSINVKVPRESYVKWTSTRRIMVYNGVQYEIQELKAVPTSSRSSLYGSATVKEIRRQNIKATGEFLKAIIPTVMGMVPNEVGVIGNGLSIYQACRGYNEKLTSNTKVEDVKANSTITVGTDYVFDYVKIVGYKDEGHQILCYAGNNVNAAVTTVIPTLEFKVKSNAYKVDNKTRNDKLTVSSPKINNRSNTACANYVKHSKRKNMNAYYNVQKFEVRLLGKSKKTVWVPKPNYGF